MNDEILSKIENIIRDVIDDDELHITEEMRLEEIEDWDSVTQMTVMAMVESEFGVQFSMKQLVEMRVVREIVETVAQR